MKTNYKQSQAAPHAKPIFTVSRNDSTLYVLPAYLAGAVMIRLQHIADGDKVKKLCCKVKNDRLMAMEQDVPQGNVTLTAVDIISPEKCAEKGYRKDGYGYVRTLLVTPTAEHRAMFSITCTLGERDAEGHICSCGEWRGEWECLFVGDDGTPLNPSTINEWLDKLTERNGLPHVTVHSLRHLCATLLIRTHADPKTVQTILRHANVSTTLNIYAKVFDSTQMEAIGRVQASLENMLKESCSSSAQV